ncbi:sialidase family protein [Cyclobacterium marinum]|uniref:BNR repeat-containing glycosyl hydrolase n=1 Tax=Cyclobacterium marinum (strain ATCC 25205 / DSM 745 / LMG 13164 / NCIMB 1802) TaxID=880070 RepID=G0J6X4_CYCMS|nr:sialidase family protein [Cyclobacterium marinum]AEL26172.1 BNR repeat-containing glycosyl hydrolase [Cyclobacterium marinum DSM 745]
MLIIHRVLALTMIIAALSNSGKAQHAYLNSNNGKSISIGALVYPEVDELKGMMMGPFVKLFDGGILTVDGTDCIISRDEGMTWERFPVFDNPESFLISDERAILSTSNGVIVLAFMNLKERANWDWQEEISDSPGARLPTYTVRSLDGGKTWQDVQKLHNEWTGAIRDMIETENGNIVFTSMMMWHHPGHHTVLTYKSGNEGKTWERSNIIDLGGIGHHSGVTEATLESLPQGKLWLLMRTNWGTFWEAFSTDDGKTWNGIRPTDIPASSAPGLLKRLESGRLVLVWNRRFPEGTDYYPLTGGDKQWSEVAASNHRDELSIAFSEDEGRTWSAPSVIAKIDSSKIMDPPLRRISYPYVFERSPGELWVTTMQGGLRVRLYEKDFIKKK